MTRPAFIAELLEAAEKAAKLKYNVTCDKPGAAPFILLASPANMLDLARYIEELEAALRLAEEADEQHINCEECDGETIPEICGECFPKADAARLARWAALGMVALKSKENEHE